MSIVVAAVLHVHWEAGPGSSADDGAVKRNSPEAELAAGVRRGSQVMFPGGEKTGNAPQKTKTLAVLLAGKKKKSNKRKRK